MPERARARRADWAPGPGVLVPLPLSRLLATRRSSRIKQGGGVKHTTSGTDLDVEGSDAELLAAGRDVLGSQHGSVGRRLVTVGLDLHTTSDTADGFTTAGITQKLAPKPWIKKGMQGAELRVAASPPPASQCSAGSVAYEPEIGDVDEGVVLNIVSIRLEDISCHGMLLTKLAKMRATVNLHCQQDVRQSQIWVRSLTAENELTLPDLGAQGDVLLRRTSGLLGGHLDCDPVVLDFAVVVPANAPVDGRLSEF